MKPLVEAQREVLDSVSINEPEEVPAEAALGLVLAGPVTAPHDVPPFANSAMDGYAVRSEDVAAAPVELTVLEDVAAGYVADAEVRPGTAVKIMTGAPIPTGADTVVKVEDTSQHGSIVEIHTATPFGTAVRHAGGDVASGSVVFEAGTLLTPAHIAVLATLGMTRPWVHRRPRISILSTGDEVRPPETGSLLPGQIRDSNRPLLKGLATELGVDVIDHGIVRDDAVVLRQTLLDAARTSDAILTSGGVSMGDYDLVKQVLVELGDIDLWKIAMQPAKPFAFGSIEGTPLFGLPGNPVSVLVAFEQFARPALSKMMGRRAIFRQRTRGVLAESVATDPQKTVFLRVVCEPDGSDVRLAGGQSSNVLSAAALAEAFAVVPVGISDLPAGAPVDIEWFRRPATRSIEELIEQ